MVCLALFWQNGICLCAAVSLNLRLQTGHWTKLSFYISANVFSSAVNGILVAFFKPALNWALCNFHFGILFEFFSGCFFVYLNLLFWVGGGCRLKLPSVSTALFAAVSNAFLFDWNTFSHIFSCLARTLILNWRPHPFEH